jgi:hypothetical protein
MEMGPLSVEEVLAAEAKAIRGETLANLLPPSLGEQNAQSERLRLNADGREDIEPHANQVASAFYRSLNKLNRAALCCSGEGVRSATFCLGVIQALASFDTSPSTTSHKETASGNEEPKPKSLLGRFHYLSTVSGGSYIGSWLSCWRTRDDFSTIIRNLTGRLIEPAEVSWLRGYRNYLTPRLGLRSADARALVAISVRNLVLIWLIAIPIICFPLLLLKILATIFVWATHSLDNSKLAYTILVIAVFFMISSQSFTTRHRPTRQEASGNISETTFLLHGLLGSIISAIFVAMFFSSFVGGSLVSTLEDQAPALGRLANDFRGKDLFIIVTTVAGLVVYVVGWVAGLRPRDSLDDLIYWALSGLAYGFLVGLGASFYMSLNPYSQINTSTATYVVSSHRWLLLLPIVFGVSWVLFSQWIAEIIFSVLISNRDGSDSDREWLDRTSDWLAVSAVVWAVTALLVFGARDIVHFLFQNTKQALVAAGFTGIASALLSKSWALLIGRTSDDQNSAIAVALKLGIAVVSPILTVIIIIGLSIALDDFLLGGFLVDKLLDIGNSSSLEILGHLEFGFIVITIIGLLASYFININRFSLYAFRRTRLIRSYLGASSHRRKPNLLTGFDPNDNILVHELSSPKSDGDMNLNALFHVINISLDLNSTKRLGWEERETHPFTITPLHCGSDYLGFRRSEDYGGIIGGISLGTAMAISGAGISANSGYGPLQTITRILTPFNVRLGWWLGNPGSAGGGSYRTSGPKFAGKMLFQELFGQTTELSPYVYLSDGGHFEKLGLYEMVRRRCRLIVVIDADCDPQFTFQGLSDAVRKIYNDFRIRITLEGLEMLRNRPNKDDGLPKKIPYHAIGRIRYRDADGFEEGCEDGYLLYIKPAYHGTEGTGIRSQATANPKFPHEDLDGQWITESQFESYRILGLDITTNVLTQPDVKDMLRDSLSPHRARNADKR